ncbi:TonB-dependent receptor [Sphingomonas canadensis]|uniref:TonB-dependent receptor n=1 Tax=Sphingomonas canadensis TaxID=1219257 RepID=A0ABW3H7K6_9SPHN|nr:TonB-dependent receptor [Sphingomonas canadensis]MCW3836477.1 TonB-dependent receptor [Sphingomonas canadensis]
MRAGASFLAIAAMGLSAAAWAQDAPQQGVEAAPDGEGETIVVTGRRAALEAADARKQKSESIINSVVADEAGKLPDNSITEVLQRVSGVSIVRFAALNDPDHYSVEGSGIQVRGLSGVASRLNGREIFSANGGRGLIWGDVTPELMQAVDVYKSATADLIEGGTGGQVDLRTKLPFDFSSGLHFAASGEVSYGDLAKGKDYAFSGLVAGRWDTGIGDIGVLVDLAHSRLTSLSNFFRAEPYFARRLPGETSDVFIPGGFDFGDEEFKRDRTGIYAALQWAPSQDLELTGIFFQSRYKNTNQSHFSMVAQQDLAVSRAGSQFDANGGLLSTSAMFMRDPNTFVATGGGISSGGGTEGTRSKSLTRDLSGEFAWQPGQGPFRLSGSYQHVLSTSKLDRLAIFRDVAYPSSFGLDLSGDFPVVSLAPGAAGQFTDPANYFWAAAMPHNEDNRGTMNSADLDAEYTFDDSFFRSVKIGGRWSDRKERDYNNGYTWTALGRGWTGVPTPYSPQLTFANAAAGDVDAYAFDNFFHGQIAVPAQMLWPTIDLVRNVDVDDLHRAPPTNFCGPADWGNATYFNCSSAGALPSSTYGNPRSRTNEFINADLGTWRTQTWAAYAQVRFGRDYEPGAMGFSGNVGARVVRVKNESQGFIVQNAFTYIRNGTQVDLAGRVDPRGGTATFTRFLPAVNLQLQPAEDVKLRFAYNVTMDLPTFNATRGGGSTGVATTANPVAGQPGIFTNFTATTGNPFLKPAMSTNLDLSLEWYAKPGTLFHLNAFYKHIKDLPIYALTQRDITVYYSNGTTETASASASDVASATSPAKVKGIEIGGRAFLDMLPGVLGGFGVEANYTYIDSKNPGDLYRDIFGTIRNDAPLQGLSTNNYNVALLYERGKLSARVAYSWRSKYLQSTNSNGTTPTYTYVSAPGAAGQSIQIALPVYGDAYGQVDAGVTFKATDFLSFSLQGTNLLNATQRTLMGGYKNGAIYTRSWFQSDRRVSFGANLAF